jgi:hypothetical protein
MSAPRDIQFTNTKTASGVHTATSKHDLETTTQRKGLSVQYTTSPNAFFTPRLMRAIWHGKYDNNILMDMITMIVKIIMMIIMVIMVTCVCVCVCVA